MNTPAANTRSRARRPDAEAEAVREEIAPATTIDSPKMSVSEILDSPTPMKAASGSADADGRWDLSHGADVATPEGAAAPVAASVAAATTAPVSTVKPSAAFDPRSLGQMRAALKAQLEANSQAAALAASAMATASIENPNKDEDSDDEEEEATPAVVESPERSVASPARADDGAADALGEMMGGLSIAPLRGVAPPAGVHLRFDDEGTGAATPGASKPILRGVAPSQGTKIVFED